MIKRVPSIKVVGKLLVGEEALQDCDHIAKITRIYHAN